MCGYILIGMLLEGHPLLRHEMSPDSAAGKALRFLERKFGYISFVPSPSAQEIPRALLDEVSRLKQAGIINDSRTMPSLPDEPRTYNVHMRCGGPSHEDAGGMSFINEQDALTRAISEALERYLWSEAVDYFSDPLCATENEISTKRTHLQLDRVSGIRATRTPSEVSQDAFLWIRGISLIDKKSVHIPAQLVSGRRPEEERAESVLRPRTTTGLAAHRTVDLARLSGLLEIIERDAFMISWLNQMPPRSVPLTTLIENNPRMRQVFSTCERYRLRPHILMLATDAPTFVVATVIEDCSSGAPRFAVGIKAHFSFETAVTGALLEALRARINSRMDARSSIGEKSAHLSRLRYWREPHHARALEFMLGGASADIMGNEWSHDDERAHLARLVEWCRSKRYDCISVSLGTSRKNVTGRHVEMTVIPQLFPLPIRMQDHCAENVRRIAVAELAGFTAPDKPFEIPHPFV